MTENPSTELIQAGTQPQQSLTRWTPRLEVSNADMLVMVAQRDQFLKEVLRPGTDYGVIPGTKNVSLLKPGAERVLSAFGLHAELKDDGEPIIDLIGSEEHGGEPLIMYQRKCEVYRQIGPEPEQKMLVASASGACSSREKKYRWRNAERTCPSCKAEATIRVSKQGDEAGDYYCWGKIGGCGAKFKKGDQSIEGQTLGKVPNPDIADVQNTILKMSDKRALVAAAIMATGYSDFMTQDLEDHIDEEASLAEEEQPARTPARRTRQATVRPGVQAHPAPAPAAAPQSAPAPAEAPSASQPGSAEATLTRPAAQNDRATVIAELLTRGRTELDGSGKPLLTQNDMASIIGDINITREEIKGWLAIGNGEWIPQLDQERAEQLENVVRAIVAPETMGL